MDMVKQLLVIVDVQELYLSGLDAYARGDLSVAIGYFENALSLDPVFKPAREMLATARDSLTLEEELRRDISN
jgi:hypothetical protein